MTEVPDKTTASTAPTGRGAEAVKESEHGGGDKVPM